MRSRKRIDKMYTQNISLLLTFAVEVEVTEIFYSDAVLCEYVNHKL